MNEAIIHSINRRKLHTTAVKSLQCSIEMIITSIYKIAYVLMWIYES